MKEILQKYIFILRKDRARRKKLAGVLCVLSVVIALSVAWQLRFVGIAKSDKPSCGLEEHEHTDACMEMKLICGLEEGQPEPTEPVVHHHTEECYEEVRTLTCTEEAHTHGDECYKIDRTLICTQEEHTHGPACYKQEKTLTCTDTSPDHVHTDDCYHIEDVLICGKQEHTHTDDCYKIERTLICDKPEHSHSDACYTIDQKLICGMEEGQILEQPDPDAKPKLHKHTDACYEITYTCGKQEHIHTLECYANSNADVETSEVWERTLPKKMGRTWNENMLLVAQSQMGYRESMKNYKIAEDGETRKGYSRYGQWAGNPYGDWNTMFVCFCLRYSGIPEAAVPRNSGAFAFSADLQKAELFEEADYQPQPGDIVLMQDLEAEEINRTAIVASMTTMLDQNKEKVPCITIIEGDRDNAVAPYKYALDDEVIMGYVSMAKAEERAKTLGILPEKLPEIPAETTPAETDPAEPQLTEQELDAKLSETLEAFTAKLADFAKAEEENNEEAARVAKLQLDQLLSDLRGFHAKRYPEAKEEDFAAYMTANAEEGYKAYLAANEKYPAEEQKPQETEPEVQETEPVDPHALKPETAKLLKVMEEKAYAYEQAAASNDEKQIRALAEQMNLLYDQAKVLYFQQYTELGEAAYTYYINENCPKAAEMLKDAEERLGTRALDATIRSKLEAFSLKAKDCAQAMNIGETEKAQGLKLELDSLYIELQDLHGKRYPDAEEGSFDVFLNNNNSKEVRWYLSAVEAFPETKLQNVTTFTDPINGELKRVFKLQDGMEVEVSVTGSICFPIEQQAEVPVDAKETTANLETVVSHDGTVENTTKLAAEGMSPGTAAKTENPDAGIQIQKDSVNPDAGVQTLEEPVDPDAGIQTLEEPVDPDAGIQTLEEPVSPDAGIENKEEQPGEKPQDNRWSHVTVDVVPVSEDAELAFAEYLAENNPQAKTMTMLGLRFQYNGKALDMGNARINVMLTPSAEAPAPQPLFSTMMLMEESQPQGPVIQNAEVVDSAVDSMYLKEDPMTLEEPVTDEAPKDEELDFVILEQDEKGKVTQVANAPMNPGRDQIPDLVIQPRARATYAAVRTDAASPNNNKKPTENYAWPEVWGGEINDENFILRNDPYFIGKIGTGKFETPAPTIGYILRNYNAFVMNKDDAIITRHIIGATACAGDAYYGIQQGGNAGGQGNPQNYAPTYIQGLLRHVNTDLISLDEDYVPARGGQGQNINIEQDDPFMPTYLGKKNMPKKNVAKQDSDFTCAVNWRSPEDQWPQHRAPYYYVDNYFKFEEFRKGVMSQLDFPKGFEIKAFDVNTDIDRDGYRWVLRSDGVKCLYIRIGWNYEIAAKDLEGIQIHLLPPIDHKWTTPEKELLGGTSTQSSLPKRAFEMAAMRRNTVIRCKDDVSIHLHPTKNGRAEETLQYCVKDEPNFDGWDHGIAPGQVPGYADLYGENCLLLIFPKLGLTKKLNEKTGKIDQNFVEVHTMEGHIIAPNATVKVMDGDHAGGIICDKLRSRGDLHVLRYGMPSSDISINPVFKINKKIREEGKNDRAPVWNEKQPEKNEVFKFKLQVVENPKGPVSNGQSWTGTNEGSQVKFKDFLFAKEGAAFGATDMKFADADFSSESFQGEADYWLKITEDAGSVPSDYQPDENVYYMKLHVKREWTNHPANNSHYYVAVLGSKLYNADRSSEESTITFYNTLQSGYTGPELPRTGGIGVLPFIVTGLAFTIIPITLLYTGRRKERR